ncbi:cytochrome C assembly family protein [Vogesella indigofera]|uniref:cytochrome C assembly family protein n=1 Tax=Vogesella indigofera TaxID=45465 RepID=UPI00234EDB77|nr:cytochrome c biogenesis protein CcsA [Vogesella indigofera]MDC7712008.1 cytochrome c biogenesis protein CcsA [Vogesella indigofera]
MLWPRQSGIEHSLLGALLLLHAIVLTLPVFHSGTVSLGLGTALSLLSWMMLLIFWTGSYFSRMEGLQTFLVPVAFVAVLLAEILPLPRNTYAVNDVAFLLHMVVSLLAYSLFAIGALIAILMLMQERALHERKPGRLSGKLPPLMVMENLMFQTLGTGFLLLTASLASGVLFSEEVFGKPAVLSHKTVFAVTSWLVFGALLVGRKYRGWRGRMAIRWTLGGFALLLLAYIGTKAVMQFVLH